MAFMRAEDAISGKHARAFSIIDGERYEMFYAKDVEATVTKNKKEVPVLGVHGTQHKSGGWSGAGTMTVYYVTSIFRRMMLKYIKTGVDTNFDLIIENDDPSSRSGVQTTVLKGVNLDSVVMAKLDVEDEGMEESMPFTFNDVDVPEQFNF